MLLPNIHPALLIFQFSSVKLHVECRIVHTINLLITRIRFDHNSDVEDNSWATWQRSTDYAPLVFSLRSHGRGMVINGVLNRGASFRSSAVQPLYHEYSKLLQHHGPNRLWRVKMHLSAASPGSPPHLYLIHNKLRQRCYFWKIIIIISCDYVVLLGFTWNNVNSPHHLKQILMTSQTISL